MPAPFDERSTRRGFLQTAVSVGMAASVLPNFAKAQDADQDKDQADKQEEQPAASLPSYKDVRIAYIGTGGIGGYHLDETTALSVSCPCFCDVDTNNFANAFKKYPKARAYQDYRAMLDAEHKNIDGVMIGIPDHQHYPATIIAMQLGKAVYTQKPLTHTVWEARQLAQAAQRYKVPTQMGNQGHAREGWRLVYEWVRGGFLGDIKEVHTWTDRPIWPQGVNRPEGEDEMPPTVNWDVWLGPAPVRPFKKGAYHPFSWRGWWDFGCGALGDMACHTMDGVWWALDPGMPTSIEPIAATPSTADAYPKASVIKWEFPAREIGAPGPNTNGHAKTWMRPAFTSYWYDGGLMPAFPPHLELGRKLGSTGNLFIGTKASIMVTGDYGDSPRVIPEDRMKEIGKPPQLLERSPGHVREWIMAIAGEKPNTYPGSNFAYAGPFTETIVLGNVALRMGRKLDWDGVNMKFPNCPDAEQYLTKEYRDGWKF